MRRRSQSSAEPGSARREPHSPLLNADVKERARGGTLGSPTLDWWIRTALVLQSPRAVFVALREDSPEAASNRAEPVLLIVLLAGIAFVLSTRTAAHLMDDHDYDGLLVTVWTFLAGCLYGVVVYWFFGAVLYGAVRRLGSHGSYRRTRHLLAFAAVPIALSLVLWPVKLALYGGDLFHRGGADSGTGGKIFATLSLAFLVWSVGLLVLGVRAAHGWTWARAASAAAVPVAVAAVLSSL
jgi:hypothetical protein